MQNRASEIRGSRIEAEENVFPGVGSREPHLNYLNAIDFYRWVQNFWPLRFTPYK
jgi:hypothetical protein